MHPTPHSTTSAPKASKWLYWAGGISIGLVVVFCSCITLLYYIGSSITPEQRASIHATSSARAITADKIQIDMTSTVNATRVAIADNSTTNVPTATYPNIQETFTTTPSQVSSTSTTAPTDTPVPTNFPTLVAPTPLPDIDIPVMEGLSMRTTRISQNELGDFWPLNVEGGTLGCDSAQAIVFATDNGVTYALNGLAKGRTDLLGRDLYLDIDPIWLPHPSVEGLKKDIGPLIARGQELCQ